MATRVKKLARQLERPPVEVLGLLHAMGYIRYKSAQDMVADDVIDRLRREMRAGLTPVELEVRRVPSKKAPAPAPAAAPTPAPSVAPTPVPPKVDDAALEALRAEVAQLRDERDAAKRTAEGLQSTVDDLRVELAGSQEALTELSARYEAAITSVDPSAPVTDGDALAAALQARGLRGDDEFERALGALAGKRVLRELLAHLVVRDAEAVAAVLDRRLLLAGDAIAEELTGGTAVVAVAGDRAEVPSAAQLDKLVGRVGEQCLLSGLRRLTVVGLPPLWHRLVTAGLDPRIDLRVTPGGTRTAEQATADVDGRDGVVLFEVEVLPEAEAVYESAGVWMHRSSAAQLQAFLEGWAVGLRDD